MVHAYGDVTALFGSGSCSGYLKSDGTCSTPSGGGSAFTGSTATSATGIGGTAAAPTFSLADESAKSPVRFEPATLSTNVTVSSFINLTAGAKFSVVWTQGASTAHTVSWDSLLANSACTISPTLGAWTEQFFEVGSNATSVWNTSCTSSDPSFALFNIVTDASPIAWGLGTQYFANATVTLNHSTTTRALNLTGLVNGGQYQLIVTEDSTGGAALTGGTGCAWLIQGGTGSGSFPIATTANAKNIISFTYDGANCWVTQGAFSAM
jgi:hypothetical protein